MLQLKTYILYHIFPCKTRYIRTRMLTYCCCKYFFCFCLLTSFFLTFFFLMQLLSVLDQVKIGILVLHLNNSPTYRYKKSLGLCVQKRRGDISIQENNNYHFQRSSKLRRGDTLPSGLVLVLMLIMLSLSDNVIFNKR